MRCARLTIGPGRLVRCRAGGRGAARALCVALAVGHERLATAGAVPLLVLVKHQPLRHLPPRHATTPRPRPRTGDDPRVSTFRPLSGTPSGFRSSDGSPPEDIGVSCCSRGSCDTSATPDTRFPRRTRCSTARCSRPTRGGRASDQEKCLLSGRLRVERNLDRHPAKRSRAVQGGPSGPSAASRAAPPLTARRSEATKCRSRTCPRRALQPPDASNYGHWAALWAFTDPREEQERRKDPRPVLPGPDRVVGQPASDR